MGKRGVPSISSGVWVSGAEDRLGREQTGYGIAVPLVWCLWIKTTKMVTVCYSSFRFFCRGYSAFLVFVDIRPIIFSIEVDTV